MAVSIQEIMAAMGAESAPAPGEEQLMEMLRKLALGGGMDTVVSSANPTGAPGAAANPLSALRMGATPSGIREDWSTAVAPPAPPPTYMAPERDIKAPAMPGEPYRAPTESDPIPADLERLVTGGGSRTGVSTTSASLSGDTMEGTMPDASARRYKSNPIKDFFDRYNGIDTDKRNAIINGYMQLSPNITSEMAQAMAASPQLAQIMLPQLVPQTGPPTIVEVPGPYGQNVKMVWNRQTQKLVPLSNYVDGATPSASASAPPAPVPPAVAATTVAAIATPVTGTAPAPVVPTAAAPVAPAASSAGRTEGEYKIGNAVPKPPEGYVHRLASDGSGYLYTAAGEPVFETKKSAEARASVATSNEAGPGIVGGLNRLMQVPAEYGDQALVRAIGPWSGAEPTPAGGIMGALTSAGSILPRLRGESIAAFEGGAAPTEVRNRIAGDLQTLAAAIKPLIRKTGEGPWTDADQRKLENIIGNPATARTREEYERAIEGVRERLIANFPGMKLPELSRNQSRSPSAPVTAEEDVRALERKIIEMSPGITRSGIDAALKLFYGISVKRPPQSTEKTASDKAEEEAFLRSVGAL